MTRVSSKVAMTLIVAIALFGGIYPAQSSLAASRAQTIPNLVVEQSCTPPTNMGTSINEGFKFIAQTFTTNQSGVLAGITLDIKDIAQESDARLHVALRSVFNNKPRNVILAETTLDSGAVSLSRLITFPQAVNISGLTQYAIVVNYEDAPPPGAGQGQGNWSGTTNDPCPGGEMFSGELDGVTWSPSGFGDDLHFQVYLRQDAIFADGFESGNFSQWSNYSSDLGDLSVNTTAAMVGDNGLHLLLDDNTPIGMRDETPTGESRYRARFYFDPNSVVMAGEDSHVLFFGYSGEGTQRPVMRVELRFLGGYQVRSGLLDDGSTWRSSRWIGLSDRVHFFEVDWHAATATTKGEMRLWIDGNGRAYLSGVDNDTRRIERVRLGAIAGIDDGTRGTTYFDTFESRTKNYIGADPNGPVVIADAADTSDITTWTEASELTDPQEAELIREVREEAQHTDPQQNSRLYLPSLVR